MLINSGTTVKYKYSHIWTKSQSFSRLNPPLGPVGQGQVVNRINDQEKLACPS